MRNLYKEVKKRIERLDLNLLWSGFHYFDFALYSDSIVILDDKEIPYDDRFIGNTAIKLEGDNYIAIWKITGSPDSYDYDILASKLVHEMFHAYQYDNNENRWPNEYEALDYQYSEENLSAKITETELLIKSYQNANLDDFILFASMRKKRAKSYAFEITYETHIETVEGMANYVELKSLEHLSKQKFNDSIHDMIKKLSKLENYLLIRHISYSIGALLMLVAAKTKLNFIHQIGNEEKTIYELITSQLGILSESTIKKINIDRKVINDYFNDISVKITRIMNQTGVKKYNVDELIGFDPLNTTKLQNRIYFKYFVAIISGGETKYILGESVGIVDDRNTLVKVYSTN